MAFIYILYISYIFYIYIYIYVYRYIVGWVSILNTYLANISQSSSIL